MPEVVNLRRERKRRERAEASQAAAENRVRHGRTEAERANDERARARTDERLNALKLSDPADPASRG